MKTIRHCRGKAFTFVELLVASTAAMGVAIAVYAFIQTSTFLLAKNLSLNLTSNSLRSALDRIDNTLVQADTAPVLINTSAATVSGPAAGVKFDRYIGGPYVIVTTTGLASNATSITIDRTMHELSRPPAPRVGDVLRIDAGGKNLRPRIQSVSGADTASRFTVTLTAALGVAIPQPLDGPMTAKLVRNSAFIVMPSGGRNQLRFYDNLETTSNLNDATKYSVITDQVGLQSADATPFNVSGNSLLTSLRVRAGSADQRLLRKQVDEFNSFSRAETSTRPRSVF